MPFSSLLSKMALNISFVDPTIQAAYMAEAFEDTFGAVVSVELSPIKKNQYKISYKMATIRILEPSRDLSRFIDQIREHGSSSFYHRGCDAWTVKMNETIKTIKTKARIV